MAIRFLVVDDASFIRDMVKKQLRDRIPGCEVYDAADGNRAIAQLKKQHVDVIFSDWEMPGLSGEEFLRWVREDEILHETPFIMVTSRSDRDHVVKAIQAGVSDFIPKPFTSDELLKKTVKQLVKIGKSPKDAIKMASSGSEVAFASIEVLTGGKQAESVASSTSPSQSATALTAAASSEASADGVAARATPARAAAKRSARTKAQLRFSNTTCGCVVRDVSLQELSGLVQRPKVLPQLFDQVVVDIETEAGEIARVNGYLSSIAAGENKVDTTIIKVNIRFVDNDPAKFETLSKFIARQR